MGAAESSTGTNVNVCTTDDFTKSVDALVYYIDPDEEEMKIAYPTMLFDRNITDGRAMMCSILTLTIGNNQGMGDVEYGKIYDIYFPPAYLRLFDGPSCSVVDMWRILGRGTKDGGLVVGTIIKPKLGLQPKPFGEACYAFWQGGDFIKNDEPQGNQVFCQMNECIPEVVKAMRACVKETGGTAVTVEISPSSFSTTIELVMVPSPALRLSVVTRPSSTPSSLASSEPVASMSA